MIPELTIEHVSLLGLRLPVQGLLAVVGAVWGHGVFVRAARRVEGVGPVQAEIAGMLALVSAVVGGHVLALLQRGDPGWPDVWAVVRLQASLGALGGGVLGLMAFGRLRGVALRPMLDAGAWAWLAGWPMVRLGCALVHDHLGPASTGPLAVAFSGGGRYDLGLLEWLASLALGLAVWVRFRATPANGRVAAFTGLGWVALRVPIEVLRMQSADPGAWRAAALNLAALAVIAVVCASLLRPASGRPSTPA